MTPLTCSLCGADIPSERNAYRKVTGWEKSRGAFGGTNALTLRETHDEWACLPCIDHRAKRGVNPHQERML